MACGGCLDCTDITIPTGSTGATGPAGPAGANGTNGVDGVSVLHNDISNSATTGTSLEILKTYTMPADTLDTDGSYIEIEARFSTSTETTTSSAKIVGVYFNGSMITLSVFNSINNINVYEARATITRFSNTSGRSKYEIFASNNVSNIVLGAQSSPYSTIGALNFTTTAYDVTARGNSDVIGDLTCESLIVTKYKK